MTDRPILFSAPMVRAIIAGRKTQTRRIARRPTDHFHTDYTDPVIADGRAYWTGHSGSRRPIPRCHAVGDRLWVRESLDLCRDGRVDLPIWSAGYRADGADLDLTAPGLLAWVEGYERRLVPSIHMPRSASRITLDVTDLRVERLHDISEADALAEGVPSSDGEPGPMGPTRMVVEARNEFEHLWRHINGPGSWEANPWVAAYTFRVTLANIDRMES